VQFTSLKYVSAIFVNNFYPDSLPVNPQAYGLILPLSDSKATI